MVDIILASAAAACVPAGLLLIQCGPPGGLYETSLLNGLAAFHPGGIVIGIVCLLLAQGLAVLLALRGVRLYYIRWVFRNCYDTSDDAGEAVERVSSLPLSPWMRRKLRRDIALQFMRGVWARREARRKSEGQI